ncbi:MAG: hypothetical protein ACLR1D_05510 [Dialister sp.]
MNLKGTWLNISLGGTYTLSENRYIYGTFEKDFRRRYPNRLENQCGYAPEILRRGTEERRKTQTKYRILAA